MEALLSKMQSKPHVTQTQRVRHNAQHASMQRSFLQHGTMVIYLSSHMLTNRDMLASLTWYSDWVTHMLCRWQHPAKQFKHSVWRHHRQQRQ